MSPLKGAPGHRAELRTAFWAGIRRGSSTQEAAAAAGVSSESGRRWFVQRGGVMPAAPAAPAVLTPGPPTLRSGQHDVDWPEPGSLKTGRYLNFAEREVMMYLAAKGTGNNDIARQLQRNKGTISRELRRVQHTRAGGAALKRPYRASVAQADADEAARRPKEAKLAANTGLRDEVQERLRENHSPEQISARLVQDFPQDLEMRVSPETIYQSLFVQARGGLQRELVKHLRTGRSMRKPRRREGERRGQIPGMVNISERPAEVEDRAVPGHWEGDLILGSQASASAIGTLVERATGFVLLLHLPDNHTAQAVQTAMVAQMAQLPEQLRRTLTWDQGKEMANHAAIAEATGLDIYFCDPHSPWQRGSNENTNGLLRQYFPKGSDLSQWGPGYLDNVADELNRRPRKRLGWATPAEALDKLLSGQQIPSGVATTA